ncbi:hypothetical protein L208DRAFT_1418747 [Tricholoma matsutake]|nr:hypothetical protein L208DRAFT_1418747 [Tricholoma matsutake 945]
MTKSAVTTTVFKPGAKVTKGIRTDMLVLNFTCRSTLLNYNTLFLCNLPSTSHPAQHSTCSSFSLISPLPFLPLPGSNS